MRSNKRGMLFVMSGPSGTGKGTICAELIKRENIYLSISNTSRDMRAGEAEGVTYYYVSRAEFERMIDDGEMLEYAQYNENYYGTSKKRVEEALAQGKNVLLEIEPQGAMKVKSAFPEAVLIFILPPSIAELKKRLTERGREDEEQIGKRLAAAKWELEQSIKYDCVVVNDDLEECIEEVRAVLGRKSAERALIENLLNDLK